MFLGYQIPNFEYGTTPHHTVATVIAQAHEAESARFDCLYVMDHFYPLPLIGPIDGRMFESQTLLAALAAVTSTIGLSPLVTSATYRNPLLLAKSTATIDAISGGRASIGLGTGWFEQEHRDFGFDLGNLTDRYGKLTETLQILRGLTSTNPGLPFTGRWYRCDNPILNPPLRADTEILIGGGGEVRTFGLAARFADHLNILSDVGAVPRKVVAAHVRCEEVDRDPATLRLSYTAYLFTGDTEREAQQGYADFIASRPAARSAAGRHFVGTSATVADQLAQQVIAKGIDGLVVNLVTVGHVPGRISEVSSALHAAL
ncbi:alkanesulfonate monooxygenase SsuD/methylene tetrahydromethanopterin reductase-like flavin-dependent oxidoreductase (luciferase family) [Rhodococcus sp. 27YEA15]|uniref:LLM class flavin-dependent oxidoreductase n=1 Tax=Rhodococcus sp. 27YEA15 TaxID=3156259 RepID=UPI003C7CFF11